MFHSLRDARKFWCPMRAAWLTLVACFRSNSWFLDHFRSVRSICALAFSCLGAHAACLLQTRHGNNFRSGTLLYSAPTLLLYAIVYTVACDVLMFQGSWVWIDDGTQTVGFVGCWTPPARARVCVVVRVCSSPSDGLHCFAEAEVYLPAKVKSSFRPGEVGEVEMEDGKVCPFLPPRARRHLLTPAPLPIALYASV
jgi:hypothetical protein